MEHTYALDGRDSYWFPETPEDYTIFPPSMSTLFSLNISSSDIFLYSLKGEISTETVENFMLEDNDIPNLNTSFFVKKKLKSAFEYIETRLKDRDILIQAWMPVKRGGKAMLTTKNQAFFLSPNCESLLYYRDVSRSFQFAGEEENTEENEGNDIITRVFLKKLLEWTPDVRFYGEKEYLRIAYAQQLNISGSLVLPFFERDQASCLGVIEIVTTAQRLNYRDELDIVLKALEVADLRSSDIMCPPMPKDYDNASYEATLAEIQQILKFVCDQHGLPLAQTWASCIHQGKHGLRHSEENYSQCVSPIDTACYTPHPQALGFHEACSEHHLLRGEGLVGETFITNQPCFSADVSAFSKKEYPLSHHARTFGLRACIAVRLRSAYTGPSVDFVLEFFLPFECQDNEQQRHLLGLISSSIKQVSCSLRVVTDEELLEETTSLERESVERESITPPRSGSTEDEEENTQIFAYSRSWSNPPGDEERDSWLTHMMEAKPEGEFKLTTHWIEDDQFLDDYEIKAMNFEYEGFDFNSGGNSRTRGRKPVQKRQTKTEKSISLQMLRPYFAGSLKDAAKSIGVCPTTLKRICRHHGITRWPSRKIKKVEHSLRKLQHVIDSVQGVEDPLQLGSLYSTFKINNQLNNQLSNDQKFQGHVDVPTVIQAPPIPDGESVKLKVTFGEERVRFSMKQSWKFNELLSEIMRRFKIEDMESRRVEIKYLDDDSEWVILECDADLEECLDVHNSCTSTVIKLTVNLGS